MHGAAVSVTAKKDKNYGQYKVLASFPLMLNSSRIFTLTIEWSYRFIYHFTYIVKGVVTTIVISFVFSNSSCLMS